MSLGNHSFLAIFSYSSPRRSCCRPYSFARCSHPPYTPHFGLDLDSIEQSCSHNISLGRHPPSTTNQAVALLIALKASVKWPFLSAFCPHRPLPDDARARERHAGEDTYFELWHGFIQAVESFDRRRDLGLSHPDHPGRLYQLGE